MTSNVDGTGYPHWMSPRTTLAFALFASIGLACSSSDGTTADSGGPAVLGGSGHAATSGSGGKASGGAAGFPTSAGGVSGNVCAPGATQACIGPAACKGGQVCLSSGAMWGVCDCGTGGMSSGGSGGASGKAGASGSVSTGGAGAGGTTGMAGAGTGGSGTAGTGTGGTGTAGTGTGGTGTAGTGTGGSGTAGTGNGGGGPGGMMAFDFATTIIMNSPPDIATWQETAKLTKLDLAPDGVFIDFTKKDGPNRWPDVPFGAPGDSLEYTLWIVIDVGGKWYASGCIEYWYGLDKNGGPPSGYAMNWYYDPLRWGPMVGHQPAVGEMVGFFVSAGDARNNGNTLVNERSNVVFVPFPSDAGGTWMY